MKIPDLFKEVIKDTFYDKKIEIWSSGTITDDEGSAIGDGKKDFLESFEGNFQFSTREYIQREYGLEIEADAIVTCDKTIGNMKDILVYNGKDYIINGIVPSDSHTTLLVKGDG